MNYRALVLGATCVIAGMVFAILTPPHAAKDLGNSIVVLLFALGGAYFISRATRNLSCAKFEGKMKEEEK